jgi:hypothetical protein
MEKRRKYSSVGSHKYLQLFSVPLRLLPWFYTLFRRGKFGCSETFSWSMSIYVSKCFCLKSIEMFEVMFTKILLLARVSPALVFLLILLILFLLSLSNSLFYHNGLIRQQHKYLVQNTLQKDTPPLHQTDAVLLGVVTLWITEKQWQSFGVLHKWRKAVLLLGKLTFSECVLRDVSCLIGLNVSLLLIQIL